eukprot:15330137-Ditylum_brightwellii.AAC.1
MYNMTTKPNYNKKSIHFKLVIGNHHQKIYLPVLTMYTGKNENDTNNMNETFKEDLIGVFT